MLGSRLQVDEQDRIVVLALDNTGAGVTGDTLTLTLRRDADGYFFNGTTFQSTATTVSLTETDSANVPGFYHYDWTPRMAGSFTMLVEASDPSVVNGPFSAQVKVGGWIDYIDDEITSRGSDEDMNQVLSRFGGSIVDIEFRRLLALVEQLKFQIAAKKV